MLPYTDRISYTTNPTTQRLFALMDEKQTNLCVAADVTTRAELLLLADILGPEICVLKTHIDIIEDFDDDLIIQLQRLSEEHNFLIFEDRKFADIGNTVKYQYQNGIYHIADWAHITNAHTVPGPGIIEGLKKIGLPKGRGLLLLAEMSSKGTLAKDSYTQETLEMAKQHRDFVIGFITTKKLLDDPMFINFTPGVQLTEGEDTLGQQYLTPKKVIGEYHSDIIIVGRGIYGSSNPLEEAKKYRERGWSAYQKTIASA
ncbi:MAG TPA: orotidine-5'-phosphate decarboxylase [Candidatus Magasanikbacteria bacterium]|nr:MAG: orotidine 5'-phosphate decarboxylase [Candidatus Magasanikbacteria bacterium RIFCSPLOWO2_02_FULL_47_16]OGH79870.1 MAG: orotidine 5'-phosphate decarboxylase [Candidatus Magasanikbacteria bacterium RIFCSPHIGHO2_02_FULL_48_18]HAZ28194.1 orotidine-5'-phosphate decarboxylase [Candidatus Magasanikbacteria bacterium]